MNLPKTFDEAVQNYREALKQAAEATGILAELEGRVSAYKALIFGEGAKSYWKAGGSTIPNTPKPAPARSQPENDRSRNGNTPPPPAEEATPQGGVVYGLCKKVSTQNRQGQNGAFTSYGVCIETTSGSTWLNTIKDKLGANAQELVDQVVRCEYVNREWGNPPKVSKDLTLIEPNDGLGDEDIPF